MQFKKILLAFLLGVMFFSFGVYAEEKDISSQFSIGNVKIISASKKAEDSFKTSSATYVLTQDDIRRSGATSIPEALRMVPGLEVARIDSNKWAISSRGFNRQYANKLLVLMDGRAVYTPHFSGTYWDVQDTVIEDIERIEVVKGPGATLWGANAVNGVINIITKSSKLTEGALVSTTFGTEDNAILSFRQGGKIGDKANYRVYGKYFSKDESAASADNGGGDRWLQAQSGFRLDWSDDFNDNFTFSGDVYRGKEEQALLLPGLMSVTDGEENFVGFNIMGKWNKKFSNYSAFDLQMFVDFVDRDVDSVLGRNRKTFDVDFQHSWTKFSRHEIIWGAGYRFFHDEIENKSLGGINYISYSPDSSYNHLYSFFIQDKIAVIPDNLFLTLGTKLEHNYFTDFEIQPNARLSWYPNDKHTMWASVARAVRIPSRGERNISLRQGPLTLLGQEDFDSEKLIAYEIGYRVKPKPNISFDIAGFYNNYTDLRSSSLAALPNVLQGNETEADTYGGELSSEWRVNEKLSLIGSYSLLIMDVDGDPISEADEGRSPKHQLKLRSHLNITNSLSFDTTAYYVDDLDTGQVKEYTKVDARLGWKPRKGLEISLVGQNLLDDKHQEFESSLFAASAKEIERGIYGNILWKF